MGLSRSHCSSVATRGAAEPVRILPDLRSMTGTGVSSGRLAGFGVNGIPSDETDLRNWLMALDLDVCGVAWLISLPNSTDSLSLAGSAFPAPPPPVGVVGAECSGPVGGFSCLAFSLLMSSSDSRAC